MQMHDILQQNPEIWRLFTCAEEYGETFRDGYDRFPHYMSNHREPFEPRASRYLSEQGYRPEYPDDQPFAVCLTHDIDGIYRSVFSKGYATLSSLKNGIFTKALASAKQVSFVLCIEFLNLEILTQAAKRNLTKVYSPSPYLKRYRKHKQ